MDKGQRFLQMSTLDSNLNINFNNEYINQDE